MKKILIIFGIFAVLFMFTFGSGRQWGRYSLSGKGSRALDKQIGALQIFRGSPLKFGSLVAGPDRNLFYILAILPEVKAKGSSNSSSSGTFVTEITGTWLYEGGETVMEIRWNRMKDVISVGDEKYNRAEGNVFVLRRSEGGLIIGQQLRGIIGDSDPFAALSHIKDELPDDQLIQGLKLVTLNE